jgi:membrane fusion protein, copper/silver efflux system
MKNKNYFVLIVLVLVIGTGGLLAKKSPSGHAESKTHKEIYYCPMHPQYTSDRPGVCPICNMNLVKKEAPAGLQHSHGNTAAPASTAPLPGYSTVSIDPHKQQLIGVKTTPVVKRPLVKTIRAYGYVAHDLELYEAQLEYIEAWREFYSFLARRPVKDKFRTDWREYYIKGPSENRWRSQEKVKAQERVIKADYNLRHMGLTNEQLAQLREVKYGEPWVQPDLLFFEKDQPFWIYAQILENDLGFIAPSQKVVVTISVYHEKVEGVIKSIAPFIDPGTRTSRARIELPNYRGELSVNMFANVEIPVEMDNTLVVPDEAVMDTGLNKIVFVKTQEGVFEPRLITTGFDGQGMVAVKSGLKEGESVVTSANFLIDSESRLKAALESFSHAGHGGQ